MGGGGKNNTLIISPAYLKSQVDPKNYSSFKCSYYNYTFKCYILNPITLNATKFIIFLDVISQLKPYKNPLQKISYIDKIRKRTKQPITQRLIKKSFDLHVKLFYI